VSCKSFPAALSPGNAAAKAVGVSKMNSNTDRMLFIICLPVSHAWLTLEFIGNFYDLRGDAGRNGSADQDALDDAGKSESMSIAAAALFSGKSENTIRIWAERY
jgi:hypothetical protein